MNRFIPGIYGFLIVIARAATCLADEPIPAPRVWAIVIGVENYEDATIPSARGATRDARTVAEWFASTAGWSDRQVLRMDGLSRKTHGRPEESLKDLRPTKQNLDWAILEWLGSRVKKGDIVVIYFAGQAASRPPGPSATMGRNYLLPIDARGADLDGSGWALDATLDQAGALARNQVRIVLWLDTTPYGRDPRAFPREKAAPDGQAWLRTMTRWPRVTAWLASDGRSPARPVEDAPGPFVTSLLKGMGSREQAHNLLGCLQSLVTDPAMTRQGFQTMGGVGPSVSLWAGAARVIEEAAPELIVQSGHGAQVTSVLVTADHSLAITASLDSTVRVWSLRDRSLLRVLSDPLVGVETMALDRDGSVLIAGDGVGRIFGWDMRLDRPRPFYGPPEHRSGIVDIVFLPEGKRFITRDRARRSVLWDASEGAIKQVRVFVDEPIGRLVSRRRAGPSGASLAAAIEPPDRGPGSIALYDEAAQRTEKIAWGGGRITALDLAEDGRQIAVGDSSGKVSLLEIPGGRPLYSGQFDGKIYSLRSTRSGLLVVSDEKALRLVEPRPGGSSVVLTDPGRKALLGEIDRLALANDGRWLACCSPEGRILVWRLGEGSKVEPIETPQAGAQGITPAFSADGRILLVGDADGGLRSWTLPGVEEIKGPIVPRPSIAPSRGKVAGLSPSPSARYLLEITKDDLALVWDFQEGRGCRPVPGRWISGAFLPDESKLVLAQRPDEGGSVVLVDRLTGELLPRRFERPSDSRGQPSNVAFSGVVVSKTGKWAAASSMEGQEPLACVWSVETGKLVHAIRNHDRGLTGVDLSSDEAYLLTSSADGTARVWAMAELGLEPSKPVAILTNPAEDSPSITSARFCPGRPDRVVAGTAGGFVLLWSWERGKQQQVALGPLEGSINATAFTNDGKWVIASSSLDKMIRFWSIPEIGKPVLVPFTPRPNHSEQVGSLAVWPNGSIIVSGGDDGAIKFWNMKQKALAGTLLAQVRNGSALDWLAFTPEGLFDGSLPGESMVKWRVGEKVVTLEQSQDKRHVFQLAGAFPRGEKIRVTQTSDDSPPIKIARPEEDRVVDSREVELVLWTGDADPATLRLYQNGVPVKGSEDFSPTEASNLRKTKVILRRGDNKFYAMVSRPGSVDGRTEERTIRYEGPEPPGRVHTLAIGVSEYENRRLRYAHRDAEKIAGFLDEQQRLGKDEPGEKVILRDSEVNLANIENAFLRIRGAVKGRPQDTVVLFIAGHTDTDSRNDQFCLLLPDFPFQAAAPVDPSTIRVATRGDVGGDLFQTRVGDPGVLPYVVFYSRMAKLEALQRLVIVDACQAGAILEDPAVRNLQRLVEKGSRNVRTSYLLAARRGEPANEAEALKHGLLTYTLLHGMKATGLERIPDSLGGFPGKPSADLNLDGIVTTEELIAYTDDALPKLARLFPEVVIRNGNKALPPLPGATDKASGTSQLEGRLKLQAATESFPLIKVP